MIWAVADSNKPWIIEHLFNQRWDPDTKTLVAEVVTMEEVTEGIRQMNSTINPKKPMSVNNPANFIKDYLRKPKNANASFPPSIFARGYTVEQYVGEDASFRFVKIRPGQKEPFPEEEFDVAETKLMVESLSLSRAALALGRDDENWLIQLIVRTRIVETHFAMNSPRRVRQVDFLQANLKLRDSEIDALFLLTEEGEDGAISYAVATCEVKGLQEDATQSQIIRQPLAYFKTPNPHHIAVPLCAKSMGDGTVRLIEYKEFTRGEFERPEDANLIAVAVSRVEVVPHVAGVVPAKKIRR